MIGSGRAFAGEVTFESGPTKTHLIELYTSEGCSSCPPAEMWLSKLKNEPKLWRDFIPLAFHVDYWDRLGWRDPYAAKSWTSRQQEYSARWNASSVYTPGFVLDGREWRNASLPVVSRETVGTLKLTVTNDETVVVTFRSSENRGRMLDVHVATLGFGLSTDVTAGENRGRKLQHDFVVLALVNERLPSAGDEVRVPINSAGPNANAGGRAIAAWITTAGEIEPIQVVGGWLR